MKLSYKFFKEYPKTRMVIGKLMNTKFEFMGSSYKVKKMVNSLEKEFSIFVELLKEKESMIEWSEDNKKILNNAEVSKAFEELYSHEFDLPFEPLNSDEVSAIKNIAPTELDILEMLCDPNAFETSLYEKAPQTSP